MIVPLIVSNDSIKDETTLRSNSHYFKINHFYFRENWSIKCQSTDKPSPKLRKQNRIKTIHSSLKIERNTLAEEQMTALLENKRVIGPKKDVLEVLNAIKVYENLEEYNPASEKSFLI